MTEPTPGAPVPPSAPLPPSSPFPSGANDPNRPGSRAWVEQRYGRTADFSDRILPGIIDGLLPFAAALVPLVLGIVCIIAGAPKTYDCGYYSTCEVPGSGSGPLIGLGILLLFLTFLVSLAVVAWNRVWRVTKTGQSIGKKVTGLKLIDAETGAHPTLGPAALRELVHQFAGIISWIWMLIDDDDRTLADIVGKTHVIHADKS
ncbi:RDD family protein [Janibacter limosus]|uniref:RDD family protein n=1 Tax=Janibacter limosus TaxID=53458 RepID=UPI000830310C|nr:RDD family protein [Janibacter limosus]